jgi:hypothetical protein
MLIYNLTVKIENDIEYEWLQWQNDTYVPEVMSTGLFYEHRFFKLLEQDETEGKTYVFQFYAINKKLYEKYILQHSEKIRNTTIKKWGDNFIIFESLLETVQ